MDAVGSWEDWASESVAYFHEALADFHEALAGSIRPDHPRGRTIAS